MSKHMLSADSDIPFDGFAAPGFESVVEAFQASFADGAELGVQFCVFKNGQPLVDLKGGWADKARTVSVTTDTLFSVFSSGKAIAALVVAHLVDQGRLNYVQPVSDIWPEFAAHGKGALTVAEVLSHQAGLCGITDENWTSLDWYDWDRTCATLAAQAPLFLPASASGYHPITYGFLAGEIARRVDIQNRSLGQILREEICADSADVWIGLPESEHARCATMVKPKGAADLGELNTATRAAFLQKWSVPSNRDLSAWRQAEFAATNCHATANGLARLMQLAVDGKLAEKEVISGEVLAQLQQPRVSGPNLVLPFDITFAAGLMTNSPNFFYGPNAETVGHSGWGGSCLFADPVTGLHGAYVMNRQENILLGDQRPRRLIDTLYACI